MSKGVRQGVGNGEEENLVDDIRGRVVEDALEVDVDENDRYPKEGKNREMGNIRGRDGDGVVG